MPRPLDGKVLRGDQEPARGGAGGGADQRRRRRGRQGRQDRLDRRRADDRRDLHAASRSPRSASPRAAPPSGRGRDRARRRRRPTRRTSSSATTVTVATAAPKRAFKLVGLATHRPVDRPRRGDGRRLRSPDGAGAVRQARQGRLRVRRRPRPASRRPPSAPRSRRCCRRPRRCAPPRRRPTSSATTSARGSRSSPPGLLAFAFIAVLVGAFLIFNTFSITVAQRSRELALLRTLGATRRQVLNSVLLEALTIGLLGSIVGILAGPRLRQGDQRAVQGARHRPARPRASCSRAARSSSACWSARS